MTMTTLPPITDAEAAAWADALDPQNVAGFRIGLVAMHGQTERLLTRAEFDRLPECVRRRAAVIQQAPTIIRRLLAERTGDAI